MWYVLISHLKVLKKKHVSKRLSNIRFKLISIWYFLFKYLSNNKNYVNRDIFEEPPSKKINHFLCIQKKKYRTSVPPYFVNDLRPLTSLKKTERKKKSVGWLTGIIFSLFLNMNGTFFQILKRPLPKYYYFIINAPLALFKWIFITRYLRVTRSSFHFY